MLYSFEGQLISEGNRSFIRIPFNIWEETGLKGTIPARIKVNDCSFECKLLPKGKGCYFIMETLDYYGISYSDKMVYPKGDDVCLPKCCIAYIDGGFNLWYKGRFYGASVEKQSAIISYLEIDAAGNE